jgi:MbtH protein
VRRPRSSASLRPLLGRPFLVFGHSIGGLAQNRRASRSRHRLAGSARLREWRRFTLSAFRPREYNAGDLFTRELDDVVAAAVVPTAGVLDEAATDVGEGTRVFEGDSAIAYEVLVNDEEQYSIWPQSKSIPDGWTPVGFSGQKADSLARIEEAWADRRSLREAMGADRRE